MVDGVNPRADADLARLRRACTSSVGDPSTRHLILIGEGDTGVDHEDNSWGTLAGFGIDIRVGLRGGAIETPDAGPAPEARILPPALTTGLLVAQAAGVRPERTTAVELGKDDDGAERLSDLIESPETTVIAIGDGSARSTQASPGPYAPEAAAIDARIIEAIANADIAELSEVTTSAHRAGDLQMSGLKTWAAVCSILEGTHPVAESPVVHARPFGVEYFVGRWSVGA